jgi:hypothetical protein
VNQGKFSCILSRTGGPPPATRPFPLPANFPYDELAIIGTVD